MSDINDAMGIRPDTDQTIEPKPEPAKPKPKPKRSRPSRAKPKPTAEDSPTPPPRPSRPAEPPSAPSRIRAGQSCPKCSRGLIGVVRTRLYRLKNKRVIVLGCRNQRCLWDLDGDNHRVNPINPGRPVVDD